MIKNIQNIIGGYSNPYFIILIFIMLAVLDVLGIGTVPLLIKFAIGENSENADQNWVEGLIPIVEGYSQIEVLSALVVLLFFIKSVLFIYSNYLIFNFSYGVMHQNRAELVSLLVKAKYQSIMNRSAADFINLLQLHINQSVSNYLIPALKLVSDILVSLFILTYLLVLYPYVTLFLLAITLLLSCVYLMLTRNLIYEYGKRSYENNHAMIDLSKSIRTGFVDITINGGVTYFKDLFVEKSQIFSDLQSKSATLRVIPRPLFELVIIVFVVFIVLLNYGEENATAQLALFATFGIGAVRLLPAVTSIIASLSLMKNNEAAVEKYFVEKKNLVNIQSCSGLKLQIPTKYTTGEGAPLAVSNLSVRDINFYYEKGDDLLNSLSFTLNKGDTIGIIGSSGSGKSTLVSIILGFLEPIKGQVLLDGVSMDDRIEADYFSYVPQFPFISNDTLLNNIVYPGGDMNIPQIKEIMDSLGLSDLHTGRVAELSDIVGENGIQLSGGQAQRVALVRAIIQDKDIIIIDEGTSALDQDSSDNVIQLINKIRKEKIIIIISHRKDILEICNRVYSLDSKAFNEV
tara:strand:+ start:6560 stop:8278 length:1719 start_codon:yes stop_codon:yes gene_type:complete